MAEAEGDGTKDMTVIAQDVADDEKEFDEIMTRLKALSGEKRRRTLQRLSHDMGESNVSSLSENPPPMASRTSRSGQSVGAVQANHSVSSTQNVIVDTTPRRIKNFSGASKIGGGEVDFKHWRRAAVRIVGDNDLTENKKRLLLLQSLVGEADDAIDLYRESCPNDLILILDKVYGTTADGHDLLADFHQQLQSQTTSASQYLNNLYILICDVVQQGGLDMSVMNQTLLRQFIRGTSDEELLLKLQLEDKVNNPPSFPDLIEAVRRVEARRTERKLRQRKVAKLNMSVNSSDSISESNPVKPGSQPCSTPIQESSELEGLKQQLAELQEVQQLQQRVRDLEKSVSRSVFCYRCGQENHIAVDCTNAPNKALVEEKSKLKRNKQGNWKRLSQRANVGNSNNN